MALDVEPPDPPTLRGPQDPGDYEAVDEPEEWTGDETPREALAEFLQVGAWADAFDEWRELTVLTATEYKVALDLGLFDEFDFYWHPSAEDVGYRAPSLPDDLPAPHGETAAEVDVADIESELDELGRIVSEVLENEYVDRSGEEFGFFSEE